MTLSNLWLLGQTPDADAAAGGVGIVGMVFALAVVGIIIASWWKIFEKAGKPGWAAIVPIYNLFVLTEISGRPILWFILLLIPCTAPIAFIVIYIDLAKAFGKDTVFALGLVFLGVIFLPILAFSDARYVRPVTPV